MAERFAWIPMSDGARLAATLYLPDRAGPQPAILEALPYRKDDVTAYGTPEYRRLRDEGGFAVCRVDVRGTGSSDGLAVDEYPPQEQRDMCEVIAWLAAQSWCSGRVGMYGTSYSGFNSIQVAMERPPALAAICTIFSTDDRYTDDVHYGGGIRRALDLVDYPLYMVAMNALPPVPRLFGEGWREAWTTRVERLEPWILRWLEEQTDGPYWRHGSLRPNYDAIECATMIVGGWADGYHNMTWRTFERLNCPKRLLIGPWAHTSTETSKPGPRIDLVPEMIRWWDRWLRDERNGVDDEPPITVFVRRSTPPAAYLDEVRGEFRFEPRWPPERARTSVQSLSDARAPGRADAATDAIDVRGDVGATASIWCAGAGPFGQPFDQRPDEVYSLVYEWPPLEDELEILGYPRVKLAFASSEPVAFVSLKLCDVFEDGTSALVSRTAFNLTHRHSHAEPKPLEPGAPQEVIVELDATSWVFEPGHCIRLDVAGADWPNVWPPPGRSRLTIERAGSALVLPVVAGAPPREPTPSLPPPRPEAQAELPGPPPTWRIEHDVVAARKRVVIGQEAATELDVGGHLLEHYWGVAGVSTEDPGDSWVEGRAGYELRWPEATVTSESRLVVHSDRDSFRVELELAVGESGRPRRTRRWRRAIYRRLA
jgi:predicted acyl esterase